MLLFVFFQAEDGIRDLVRSRGLGDVYKRQAQGTIPVILFSGSWVGGNIALDVVLRHQGNVRMLSLIHI